MREISATEAARRFSEVLDAVEHRGESFVIRRKGRAVARLEPAGTCTWGELRDILRKTPVDKDWAEDLRELRSLLTIEERRWRD